ICRCSAGCSRTGARTTIAPRSWCSSRRRSRTGRGCPASERYRQSYCRVVTPLFLIGFMASGKTSVGRAIASASGRRFVDLDDVIALGGIPVANLVARDEPEFRRREAAALLEVIESSDDGPVVATGGGAAAHGDNLARMRAAGLVVALAVD